MRYLIWYVSYDFTDDDTPVPVQRDAIAIIIVLLLQIEQSCLTHRRTTAFSQDAACWGAAADVGRSMYTADHSSQRQTQELWIYNALNNDLEICDDWYLPCSVNVAGPTLNG
jgi:hypothetical protein